MGLKIEPTIFTQVKTGPSENLFFFNLGKSNQLYEKTKT
jgi:hypothetical protein